MLGIRTFIEKKYRSFFVNKLVNSQKIQDLMLAFRADEIGHAANTKNSDLGYGWIHYGLLREQKPQHVLCIGSRHGFIPALLAQACKDNEKGHVDFIDAGFGEDDEGGWTGVGYWKTEEGTSVFNRFGLSKYITLHVMTTKDFFNKKSKKYDYVYIDGDHSLKGVLSDFLLVFPNTKRGGYITFHDVAEFGLKPEGEYGVWKLWRVLAMRFNSLSFTSYGSGLGVMRKK